MSNEVEKDIIYIKEEIVKLNLLVANILEQLKSDADKKIIEKDSNEIEGILKSCISNFEQ